MSNKIAVFDLDGTITDKDTYLEFIKYHKGKLAYYFGFLILSPFIILFYLKMISNHKLKEVFFSYFFKGENYNELKLEGEKFSEHVLPNMCRKAALKVLDWHVSQNHDILILSASADIWLKKWSDLNKFQLICTEFEVSDNKYTGKLNGNNCHGLDKKTRLIEFLSDKDYTESFGYGDSKADSHYLELVDHPYLMELDDVNVAKHWHHNS